MTTTENNTHTAQTILASVKTAVQNYNDGGDRAAFFGAILNAVKATGMGNIEKATKLSRVEIYDALDGVSPSFEHLSLILAFFGVKIRLNFIESASQIKDYLD